MEAVNQASASSIQAIELPESHVDKTRFEELCRFAADHDIGGEVVRNCGDNACPRLNQLWRVIEDPNSTSMQLRDLTPSLCYYAYASFQEGRAVAVALSATDLFDFRSANPVTFALLRQPGKVPERAKQPTQQAIMLKYLLFEHDCGGWVDLESGRALVPLEDVPMCGNAILPVWFFNPDWQLGHERCKGQVRASMAPPEEKREMINLHNAH
jgi:hypothetical protein